MRHVFPICIVANNCKQKIKDNMRRKRNHLIPIMALIAMSLIMAGCRQNSTGQDAEDTYDYTSPHIPPFVLNMLDSADWEADTICVVDGRAFYHAYDIHYRTSVIYDNKRVYLEDPTLWCDSVSAEEKYKFDIFMTDKEMVVDFKDKKSVEEMARLDQMPPSFSRYRKDTFTGLDNRVMFSMCVDFMRSNEKHAEAVNTWLAGLVETLAVQKELEKPQHTTVPQRSITDEKDKAALARRAADGYFTMLRKELDIDLRDDIGSCFRNIYLKAWHVTGKYVTMLKYTYDYWGGAHGYYTEELVSYDPENKQEIDWDFLFRPECNEQVLNVFYPKVPANTKYKKYCSDYINRVFSEMFTLHGDNGNAKGKIEMPQPGLGEKGVVFSFQPYQLSGFPDGTFHFTIPYGELAPYLTDKAKHLLGM